MADGSGEVAAVPASGAANGLSNGASATPAQPNNPLSRKLHKILETRLENDKVTGGGGPQISGQGAARRRSGCPRGREAFTRVHCWLCPDCALSLSSFI